MRLVDELNWLDAILRQSAPPVPGAAINRAACAVKNAAAAVLEQGADLVDGASSDPSGLRLALDELSEALDRMERNATLELPVRSAPEESVGEFISSLDPSFRAQELSFAVVAVARNIDIAAAADRRGWLDRLLGHQPDGLVGRFSAAQERATAHVERHSVWLHNSLRGAVGLGLAVLIADLSGVQHSFWVVLGALSVLRSNALNTGQNVLRGLGGTVVGFVVGALLLAAIGTNTTVLWVLLPISILLAGLAPAVVSFAAGQAAFTLVLVILFNIIAPGRLGGRAAARGGHRPGLRRQPARRRPLLAARRRRRAEQRAGRGLRRQRALPRPCGRVRHAALRFQPRSRRSPRPRTPPARPPPTAGWTTPSATSWPNAAAKPCRSPRSPAWSPERLRCAWPATPCSTCGSAMTVSPVATAPPPAANFFRPAA